MMQHERAIRLLRDDFTLARTASVVRLLEDTPVELHGHILRAISTRRLSFSIAGQSLVAGDENSERHARLRRYLMTALDDDTIDIRIDLREDDFARDRPGPEGRDGRRGMRERRRHNEHRTRRATILAMAVRLPDGRWLNVIGRESEPPFFWQPWVWSQGLAALILSLLMIVMVRRMTRPLATLAAEVDRYGRGESIQVLPEQGPTEIRYTITAFNRMRERLDRFVQDRMHMLASISHDLRTPITALRVRAELIDDAKTRAKMLKTLQEMQRMAESTLAFIREESVQEEPRLVDLNSLLESLCDDLSDTGAQARFTGPGKLPYRCRPVSLKRALNNLIENAVYYGQRVRVALSGEGDKLRIIIDDDGPGITAQDKDRVFEPFVRLEQSRNLETGGAGLGLAIARTIIHRHGGEIVLHNRSEGGLRVSVELPKT